jgi:hypothetical protein
MVQGILLSDISGRCNLYVSDRFEVFSVANKIIRKAPLFGEGVGTIV